MINPPRIRPLTKRRYLPPYVDGIETEGRCYNVDGLQLNAATARALRHLARNEGAYTMRILEQLVELIATRCAYSGHSLVAVSWTLEKNLHKIRPHFLAMHNADQLIVAELASYLRSLNYYHFGTGPVDKFFPDAKLKHYQEALALLEQGRSPVPITEIAHRGCKLGRAYLRAQRKQPPPPALPTLEDHDTMTTRLRKRAAR